MARRSPPPASPVALVAAAGLLAAGLTDPLIERLADAGLFGPGFHDDTQAGALPAVACALLVVAQIALMHAVRSLRGGRRDVARGLVAAFVSRHPARDALLAFAVELACVYAIETCEALFAGGNAPGALRWLGGPPLVSLALYAVAALIVTAAVAAAARALAHSFRAVLHVAIRFIRLRAAYRAGTRPRPRRTAPLRARSSILPRRTGERGPPLPAPTS